MNEVSIPKCLTLMVVEWRVCVDDCIPKHWTQVKTKCTIRTCGAWVLTRTRTLKGEGLWLTPVLWHPFLHNTKCGTPVHEGYWSLSERDGHMAPSFFYWPTHLFQKKGPGPVHGTLPLVGSPEGISDYNLFSHTLPWILYLFLPIFKSLHVRCHGEITPKLSLPSLC